MHGMHKLTSHLFMINILKKHLFYIQSTNKSLRTLSTILITEKKFREIYEYSRLECLLRSSVRTRDTSIWINTTEMSSLVFRTNKFLFPPPPPRIRILNISGLENIPLGGGGLGGGPCQDFFDEVEHPPPHTIKTMQHACKGCVFFYDACYLLASMDHKKKTFMFKYMYFHFARKT